MNSREMAKTIVSAMEEKKAADISIIDIAGVSVLADYFIITNGENPNQVQALADAADEAMTKAGITAKGIEGYQNANWILLDYGDVVVHIFSRDDRRFFNLERIWRDGKFVSREEL